MERDAETTTRREPAEDGEEMRDEETRGEQQADGTVEEEDEIADDGDDSEDLEARGDTGLMD